MEHCWRVHSAAVKGSSGMLNRSQARRRHAQESGAIAIVMSISAVMLFVMAALVVDLGHARDVRRQAQNAADASALAAGNAMYLAGAADLTAATNAAKLYAAENFGISAGDWSSCSDPSPLGYRPGNAGCISYDSGTHPTEVRVVIPKRTVSTPLGSVVGTSEVNISAKANARILPGLPCVICVLGTGIHDIQNGNIVVNPGDNRNVHFNGTLDDRNNGGISAVGGSITVEGSTSGLSGNYNPTPVNAPRIQDPLAHLVIPPAGISTLTVKTNPCGAGSTNGPGKYADFSNVTNACVLQPGLYVITGSTHLSGQTKINAMAGVTLYFTCGTPTTPTVCASGATGGELLMTGQNTALDIAAPTSGPTKGIAILSDRENKGTFDFRGGGGGATQTESIGTIYAKSGTLNYRGNTQGLSLNSLVVVGDLAFNGNPSSFDARYDEDMNAEPPLGSLQLSPSQ